VCSTTERALHLMRTGAAGVIVGYGSTRGVTTSDEVLRDPRADGHRYRDAAAARREYLDETGGRYVHVLADGGIHTSAIWPRPSPAAPTRWCWARRSRESLRRARRRVVLADRRCPPVRCPGCAAADRGR